MLGIHQVPVAEVPGSFYALKFIYKTGKVRIGIQKRMNRIPRGKELWPIIASRGRGPPEI